MTPPAPEPNPTIPPAPSQADGSCGTANNVFSSTAPVTPNLCLTGVSTQPATLPDGRFTWSCLGVGANSQTARCYTQSSNGKSNQPPLKLVSRKIKSPDCEGLKLLATGCGLGKAPTKIDALFVIKGGAGKGKYGVRKSSTPGTRCETRISGRTLAVTTSGKPGTCTLSVRKLQDKKFNEVESPPIAVKLNRGNSK